MSISQAVCVFDDIHIQDTFETKAIIIWRKFNSVFA